MKKPISETYSVLNNDGIDAFYNDIFTIVNYLEPSLSTDDIQKLIQSRDKLGDGLVSDDSLIIHVISEKVRKNQAVYCYLNKPVLWKSSFDNISAQIKKAMIIVISPTLKNGEAVHLEDFFNNKGIVNVKRLVMR